MSGPSDWRDAARMRRLSPAPFPMADIKVAPAAETERTTRRNLTKAACNACRRHKSKCSGERPSCQHCLRRGLQCRYSTQPGETQLQAAKREHANLQDRTFAYREVVELLKTATEHEARAVLERLRSGTDITTLLSHVKAGNVLLQMNLKPDTQLRYELPYRAEFPSNLLQNNVYMESLLYEGASLYTTSSKPPQHQKSISFAGLDSHEYKSLYLKPFHAAHVVEPLLEDANMAYWTNVCDDNALMRDLLRVFFRCEYQFTAILHKDFFLEDLVAQRDEFCSPLLVNVALAYSCTCYPQFTNRAEYWNPGTLMYRFLAEARRIWELEASAPRITTIQAGVLFNVIYNLNGMDQVGQVYRIQAVALAFKLRLLESSAFDERCSERMRRCSAYTAWALYNWETLSAFSFLVTPLFTTIPDWPLPDPTKDPKWYGELWLIYPLNSSLVPAYYGQLFRARCQFRVIMNELCHTLASKDIKISVEKAYKLFAQLKDWYDQLPGPLQPRTIVLPGHLQLHMYYYHVMLTIFEPLLDVTTIQEPSPTLIVVDAKKNLQTLIRLYYLRHGCDSMDLFIVIPLMLCASDCIESIHDDTPAHELDAWRSTLVLAAKGLHCQRRNHYLAQVLYRVIRGQMRPQEAALLKDLDELEDESEEQRVLTQAVRSHWPVSIVKNAADLDSKILSNLVEDYAFLNVSAGSEKTSSVE